MDEYNEIMTPTLKRRQIVIESSAQLVHHRLE